MEHGVLVWFGFVGLILALLAFDLGVLNRRDHVIHIREALKLSLFYVLLALIFASGVFHFLGREAGFEWLTGYLIEKSLSLDNIFVFVLLFSAFSVPPQYQHRVLFWGIMGALVMRAAMILAGAALIERFHWIIYLFGAFLIFSGIKMLVLAEAKPDPANSPILRVARRLFPVSERYHGHDFFSIENGRRVATPLFLVLILIEFTDLIFAVDSIPAIFAVTDDPFIIFSSNVFAILGLRALYFALADIVPRFIYLKYGLSMVLVLIGGKMIANSWAGAKLISVELALAITAVLIGGSIAASLIKTRGHRHLSERRRGWVPGAPAADESSPQSLEKKRAP